MAGSSNKVFVGGLPKNCALEQFQAYFEQFGPMTDVVVMKNQATGEPRGFGFVTFETPDSVDKVMDMKADHQINEKWVEVKRATPKGDGEGGGKGGGGFGKGGGGGKGFEAPAWGGGGCDFGGGYGACKGGPPAWGGPPAYGGPPAWGGCQQQAYPAYPPPQQYGCVGGFDGGYGGKGGGGPGAFGKDGGCGGFKGGPPCGKGYSPY